MAALAKNTFEALDRSNFVKSMTRNGDHRQWQDVYNVVWRDLVIYLKFTEHIMTEFIVLSFKRKWGRWGGVLMDSDHDPLDAALDELKARFKAESQRLAKKVRASTGLTQKEASQLLTGSPNSFSKYERGEAQPSWPTFVLLKLLAADPALIDKIKAA